MSDFTNDLTPAIKDAQRAAKAWLGVVQYLTFAAADGPKRVRVHREDGPDSEAVVQRSKDAWFNAFNREVEGAFGGMERAMIDAWEKRRDARLNTDKAEHAEAVKLESRLDRLGVLILQEGAKTGGGFRKNRLEREAFAALCEQLEHLVSVCDRHILGENMPNTRRLLGERRTQAQGGWGHGA